MAGDELSTARNGPGTFVKENSLSLFFGDPPRPPSAGRLRGAARLQRRRRRARRADDQLGATSCTSDFAQAVIENWQSEYLQFALFILATVWFLQRGSPESKALDKAGRESDAEQKRRASTPSRLPRLGEGRRHAHRVYSNSLLSSWRSSSWAPGSRSR